MCIQGWNRYRPLPPPPPTNNVSSEGSPEGSNSSSGPSGHGSNTPPLHSSLGFPASKSSNSVLHHGSPTPPPYSASPPPYSVLPPASIPPTDMAPPPEYSVAGALGPDPYMAMSVEARRFVDSLVSMGFSKPRVARAVEKLGQDAKEVSGNGVWK